MPGKTVHIRSVFKSYLTPAVLTAAVVAFFAVGLADTVEGTVASNADSQAPWFVDMNRFSLSAHAAFTCDDCHGTMIENGRPHPDKANPDFLKKAATRSYDYNRCQKCHKLSYQRYLEGEHAKALSTELADAGTADPGSKKKNPAPTCGECHSSHYDRSGLSRVEVGKRMVTVCARCHKNQAAGYLDNIHGKVGVNLQNPAAAFCTDCHGAHTTVSLKNPAAALPVCQRCHPKAEAEFTNFVIHATVTDLVDTDSPKRQSILWIHRIKLAAVAVVALSLIFFFGHSLLWLLRELHEKLRKH